MRPPLKSRSQTQVDIRVGMCRVRRVGAEALIQIDGRITKLGERVASECGRAQLERIDLVRLLGERARLVEEMAEKENETAHWFRTSATNAVSRACL